MRFIVKTCLLLLLLTPLVLATGLWFAWSEQPLVRNRINLSHQDIARAKALFKANDPRQLQAGAKRRVDLSEADINLAANYLLHKASLGGAKIAIKPDALHAWLTLTVDRIPLKPHLNIQLHLRSNSNALQIEGLQVGQLTIPSALAQSVIEYTLPRLYQSQEFALLQSVVEQVTLHQGHIIITYHGKPDLLTEAQSTLLIQSQVQTLIPYQQKLVSLQNSGRGTSGSLTDILPPLFSLALERSKTHQAVSENSALLTVLGLWASGQNLERWLATPAVSRRFRLSLRNRRDLAQHYLISAALAARGDGNLADAIGIFKEVTDARGGSGFSFTDIAADRAGSRLGSLATQSETTARGIQAFFVQGIVEADIMPSIAGLPEHLSDPQFQQRFSHVGSPDYNRLVNDIERRIQQCRVFQGN